MRFRLTVFMAFEKKFSSEAQVETFVIARMEKSKVPTEGLVIKCESLKGTYPSVEITANSMEAMSRFTSFCIPYTGIPIHRDWIKTV